MPKAAKQDTGSKAWPSHPYDMLPFVRPGAPGEGRCFWAPRVSGGYAFDFTLGQHYGEAALRMMRDPEYAGLLKDTILGILRYGVEARDRAVVAGMMHTIGEALAALPAAADGALLAARSARAPLELASGERLA